MNASLIVAALSLAHSYSNPDFTPLSEVTAVKTGNTVSGKFLLAKKFKSTIVKGVEQGWGGHGAPQIYVSRSSDFFMNAPWSGPHDVAKPTDGSDIVEYSVDVPDNGTDFGWVMVVVKGHGEHSSSSTEKHQKQFSAAKFPRRGAAIRIIRKLGSRSDSDLETVRAPVMADTILPITLHRPWVGAETKVRKTKIRNHGIQLVLSYTLYTFASGSSDVPGPRPGWTEFTPPNSASPADHILEFEHSLDHGHYVVYGIFSQIYKHTSIGTVWSIAGGVIRTATDDP